MDTAVALAMISAMISSSFGITWRLLVSSFIGSGDDVDILAGCDDDGCDGDGCDISVEGFGGADSDKDVTVVVVVVVVIAGVGTSFGIVVAAGVVEATSDMASLVFSG